MTARRIHFTKMHGAGNDYIYVETFTHLIEHPSQLARTWSAPHTGIGADGLVLIGPATVEGADFSMRIFNADGSEAMMCGNASRCVAKYLYEKGYTRETAIRLETRSGIKLLQLHLGHDASQVEGVTVDMLEPRFDVPEQCRFASVPVAERTLHVSGRDLTGVFVSVGNPHFVVFVEDADREDITKWGSMLERHDVFPQRCNIEFATVVQPGIIRMRVWERGSGITLACGTGACATAVAAALTGRCQRESVVRMDGGELRIRWDETDGHVRQTGPATFVFEGEILENK